MAAAGDRRGLKLWFSPEEFEALGRLAGGRGMTPGQVAKELVVAAASGVAGTLPARRVGVDPRPVPARRSSSGQKKSERVDEVSVRAAALEELKGAPMRPGETIVKRRMRVGDAQRALLAAERAAGLH